ncbi:MAG: hypothetical protein ACRDRH_29725 [Pseudonocardia sp.]
MSVYHLHARLIEGPLEKLVRNELRSAESDDKQEIMLRARELVARGFTVWIYEHGDRPRLPTASDLTVIAHLHPEPPATRKSVGEPVTKGPVIRRKPSAPRSSR